ncbi:unnamed protein product [Lota lota]
MRSRKCEGESKRTAAVQRESDRTYTRLRHDVTEEVPDGGLPWWNSIFRRRTAKSGCWVLCPRVFELRCFLQAAEALDHTGENSSSLPRGRVVSIAMPGCPGLTLESSSSIHLNTPSKVDHLPTFNTTRAPSASRHYTPVLYP